MIGLADSSYSVLIGFNKQRKNVIAIHDLSKYLPAYLFIYLSIYLSIHPSIHPSIHSFIHPSIHPSIYLSTYLFLCSISIYLPFSLLHIYLPTYLPFSLLHSYRIDVRTVATAARERGPEVSSVHLCGHVQGTPGKGDNRTPTDTVYFTLEKCVVGFCSSVDEEKYHHMKE